MIIFGYEVTIKTTNKHFFDFSVNKATISRWGEAYLFWVNGFKLQLRIEDVDSPIWAVCKVCYGDASEVFYGDEGVTYCEDCESIEQGYAYLSRRELDAR
jgi:hypothetical protein